MTRSKRAQTARGIVNEVSAPKAVANHLYTLLSTQDVLDTAKRFVKDSPLSHLPDEHTERLNEVISSFLWDAEPGTQDREGISRRYDWFADVETTAHHLQRLLNPVDNSALLLSGVVQPMLVFTSKPRVGMNWSRWQVTISSVRELLKSLEGSAGAGRESLERHIFETRTEVDGRPTVLDTRRRGRPGDTAWAQLADDLLRFWHYVSRKEPTVTVDPYAKPTSRKSVAAQFTARLLDLVATRLPPEKSWAADRLRGQEARLTEYLEGRRPSKRFRANRRKRGKSADK